ncbi:MAG: hypothetical protein NZ874_04175 [Fimbriimonadales bacterium]|nr:hypothetical protein [Fimbriimonadales bacterium]
MKRGCRYAPYLIVLLAALGFLGWIDLEHRRVEEMVRESLSFSEPDWAEHLPTIRKQVQAQQTDTAKLLTLADQLTVPYRQIDAPLRFKVVQTDSGQLVLRLNAAAALPRWYTARAARIAYNEARRALGRETPVHIYETYIVGQSRLMGVCRERDGRVEVALW